MSARKNLSSSADVYMSEEIARGGFKKVFRGTYRNGPREGENAACKIFIDKDVYENEFFTHELDIVAKATEIVERFNALSIINRRVLINEPGIWVFSDGPRKGQKILVEPFIDHFEKFNSNTGWRKSDEEAWSLAMQALSHFSYEMTGGQMVLCDLQGGIYSDGVVLTDPVIVSRSGAYGPTDLGCKGITTFFARHNCSRYCRSKWSRPRDDSVHFDEQCGTSMVVPTRNSRLPLSHQMEHLRLH